MANIYEFREELVSKVLGLGIDSRFKNNPAFSSAVAQVERLISQLNLTEEEAQVPIKEEDGKISFSCSANGERYTFVISSSEPKSFSCIRTCEKTLPFPGSDGRRIDEKECVEVCAKLVGNLYGPDDSSDLEVVTNFASINNDGIKYGENKSNRYSASERKYYSLDGVMRDREIKSFGKDELGATVKGATPGDMLYVPRLGFHGAIFDKSYESRTLITREFADVARVYKEDKKKGIKYVSKAALNQEHGLSEMRLPGGYDPYPTEVVIPKISKEEIERIIAKERDPKIQEGLRRRFEGRENFSYDSSADPNFVYEGAASAKTL